MVLLRQQMTHSSVFTIRHHFQSVQLAELTASIIDRDEHKTMEALRETVMNPLRESHPAGFLHSAETEALTVSARADRRVCTYAGRSR